MNYLRKRQKFNFKTLNFSSNDYLNLAADKRVNEIYSAAFKNFPSGSAGSPLIQGYHQQHQILEDKFCKLLGAKAALVFSSGYQANLAVGTLLNRLNYSCYIDKEAHASIYDSIKLNNLNYKRFIKGNLKIDNSQKNILYTEAIFSMSGAQANLTNLSIPAIVDEAHSFGVIGEFGAQGCHNVLLRVIPLGKACFAQGCVVVGSKEHIEEIVQNARAYIYSTAMSPALSFGISEVLQLVKEAEQPRAHLKNLVEYFIFKRQNSQLVWRDSKTQIQFLIVKDKLALFSDAFIKNNITCQQIMPPTVNRSGFRIVLTAAHSITDIDKLFEVLAKVA